MHTSKHGVTHLYTGVNNAHKHQPGSTLDAGWDVVFTQLLLMCLLLVNVTL